MHAIPHACVINGLRFTFLYRDRTISQTSSFSSFSPFSSGDSDLVESINSLRKPFSSVIKTV